MATDVGAVPDNLLRFYSFEGKVMVSVGAGGGQFAGYGRVARKVIAVDSDPAALGALAERARSLGVEDRFVLVRNDFLSVEEHGDVVLFEFALHEIPDHGAALAHAAEIAPETVVIDHAPGSPWAHVVDETEKVAASWDAIEARGVWRVQNHDTVQRFGSYQELFEKVKGQGAEAIRRIERWRGCTEITIPMAYRTALL